MCRKPLTSFLFSLLVAVYAMFSPVGAQAQSTDYARTVVASKNSASILTLVKIEQQKVADLQNATDAGKSAIQADMASIGAGVAQAVSSDPAALAAIVSLAQSLNNDLANATTDGQKADIQAQLAAIGTMLAGAVQSNPDLADSVQTALAAAGIPAVNTAYASITGNVVTAAAGGGVGGGGIGGPVGGGSTSGSGGNGGGGNSQGQNGNGQGQVSQH
jgi:hypothetical protein